MNARLRMYQYCYSNLGAIYAKGLYISSIENHTNLDFSRTIKFRGKVMIDKREYHQRVCVGGAPQSDCPVT